MDHMNQAGKVATILQINARSLKTIDGQKNKMIQFKSLVHLREPHIVTVCETWLVDAIKDDDILDKDHYTICRKDRKFKKGGGVMVAVTNAVPSKRRDDLETNEKDHNEIVLVEVSNGKENKLIIIMVYKPPDETNFIFAENLSCCFKNSWDAGFRDYLVIGDFNFPDINWDHGYPLNDAGIDFSCAELFQEYGLEQLN